MATHAYIFLAGLAAGAAGGLALPSIASTTDPLQPPFPPLTAPLPTPKVYRPDWALPEQHQQTQAPTEQTQPSGRAYNLTVGTGDVVMLHCH
jgi:hypothetical protein